MRSVLVFRALTILFPRRTDYYPVMYISFEDTNIFLSDLLYSLYGSALAAFSPAIRFCPKVRQTLAVSFFFPLNEEEDFAVLLWR